MTDKPVVVYGVSGYTGRLICEYLREYNVPFVAAGRDEDKLKASWTASPASRLPLRRRRGDHTVAALTELFTGAKVVCNTVGPFIKFGHEVVEACRPPGRTTWTPPASRTG